MLCRTRDTAEIKQQFEKKSSFDMGKLWSARWHVGFEGTRGKKRKCDESDEPKINFVSGSGGLAFDQSRVVDAADAALGDARPEPSAASSSSGAAAPASAPARGGHRQWWRKNGHHPVRTRLCKLKRSTCGRDGRRTPKDERRADRVPATPDQRAPTLNMTAPTKRGS